MEAFHFKLEKVLQYRTEIAKESERRLSVVVQQCNHLTAKRDALKEEQRRSRMTYSFGHDIALMQVAANYDERLRSQITQTINELNLLEVKRLNLQQDYLAKLKEQRVLDKLKESQLAAYKLKKQRYDEKVMDDIISSRYKYDQ